jgi:hypothetical protein
MFFPSTMIEVGEGVLPTKDVVEVPDGALKESAFVEADNEGDDDDDDRQVEDGQEKKFCGDVFDNTIAKSVKLPFSSCLN